MPKQLLIVTDSIAPPAYAPRIVSLCRHLSAQGWRCVVFSDRERHFPPFTASVGEWHQTDYYLSGSYPWRYLADKVFNARERHFQACIEQTVNVAEFDAVFCSTCYYFPLQTAYRLAKKYRKPYIVDIRDIAEQWGDIPFHTHSPLSSGVLNRALHRLYTAYNLRMRNRVLADACRVTTVSPWHRDLLNRFNPRTCLVYNGFDTNEFYPQDVVSEQFVLSYAGKIYDLHFRDPRLLFEALQQLIADQRIPSSDIRLRFHIDQASISPLRRLVEQYRLTDICTVEGYIPKRELLPLMHQSSVMLVLTCLSTPQGAHGIMGTKFYEALGVEKPVLCVRSDEECLAQVIDETHAGMAGRTVEEVKAFIMDKYREWRTKGFTRQTTRHREPFTRQYQSRQLQQLIEQCL